MPKQKRQQDAGATRQNTILPAKHNSRNYGFVKRDFSDQKLGELAEGEPKPAAFNTGGCGTRQLN
ncbi:MAG: hypothetical protein WCE61_21995 [Candidatus Acidiferrum sp.]